MTPSIDRLEELIQSSQQILEHMEVQGRDDEIRQLQTMLEQAHQKLDGLAGQSGETVTQLRRHIQDISARMSQLKADMQRTYEQVTNGQTESYESQPIPVQQDDQNAYHGKTDYKSAEKLEENLTEIQHELASMS